MPRQESGHQCCVIRLGFEIRWTLRRWSRSAQTDTQPCTVQKAGSTRGNAMKTHCLWTIIVAASVIVAGFAPDGAISKGAKIIYTFQGGDDGAEPVAPLININGVLYGATKYGGTGCPTNGCGTIFSLTTSGTKMILHKFKKLSDGIYPLGLVDAEGASAVIGAAYVPNGDSSSLFSVTTKGEFTLLGKMAALAWPTDRRPLTRVGNTWYGVDTGSDWENCGNRKCGYIFAVQP
jgi:uncharacterized repeat protein (TIGR03803 family)